MHAGDAFVWSAESRPGASDLHLATGPVVQVARSVLSGYKTTPLPLLGSHTRHCGSPASSRASSTGSTSDLSV